MKKRMQSWALGLLLFGRRWGEGKGRERSWRGAGFKGRVGG